MKRALSVIAFCFLIAATAARADEATTQPDKVENANEDCSKQVWPHFSPSCLRNTDRAINVRLVTANRR